MLEEKIDRLIGVIEQLIAVQGGKAPTAAATSEKKAGTKKAAADAPKNNADQVQAAILEVKEKKGAPVAKELIEAVVGKTGAKLADLLNMPEKFDKAVSACSEALAATDEPDEDDEDDI